MRMDFACGCFLVIFNSHEHCEYSQKHKIFYGISYLSCCIKHEGPHRKLKDILPLSLVDVKYEDEV